MLNVSLTHIRFKESLFRDVITLEEENHASNKYSLLTKEDIILVTFGYARECIVYPNDICQVVLQYFESMVSGSCIVCHVFSHTIPSMTIFPSITKSTTVTDNTENTDNTNIKTSNNNSNYNYNHNCNYDFNGAISIKPIFWNETRLCSPSRLNWFMQFGVIGFKSKQLYDKFVYIFENELNHRHGNISNFNKTTTTYNYNINYGYESYVQSFEFSNILNISQIVENGFNHKNTKFCYITLLKSKQYWQKEFNYKCNFFASPETDICLYAKTQYCNPFCINLNDAIIISLNNQNKTLKFYKQQAQGNPQSDNGANDINISRTKLDKETVLIGANFPNKGKICLDPRFIYLPAFTSFGCPCARGNVGRKFRVSVCKDIDKLL